MLSGNLLMNVFESSALHWQELLHPHSMLLFTSIFLILEWFTITLSYFRAYSKGIMWTICEKICDQDFLHQCVVHSLKNYQKSFHSQSDWPLERYFFIVWGPLLESHEPGNLVPSTLCQNKISLCYCFLLLISLSTELPLLQTCSPIPWIAHTIKIVV